MDPWDATASELLFGAIDEEEVIEEQVVFEGDNARSANEHAYVEEGSEDEWYDVE